MALSYEWTPEEQREYSLNKLLSYIREVVYPYHPYYRKLFKEQGIDPNKLNSYDDFRKIPLSTKEDMLPDQRAFVLQPGFPGRESEYEVEEISKGKLAYYAVKTLTTRYLRDLYGKPRSFKDRLAQTAMAEWLPIHFHASGGTTGAPSMSMYTNYDFKNVIPNVVGMVYLFGWEPTMRGLNLFPALPHLAFFQVLFFEFLVDGGGAVFHTCGGKAIPTERQIQIAANLPFDMYIAIPSYMTYWLKTAIEMIEAGEVGKLEDVKYAVLAAEPISEEYRAHFKEQFAKVGSPDIKIIEGYGSTELKAAFFECDERSGLHLNPEFYFWEVIDPETKEPVEWGEPGVLTFSHIDFRGTALLRYYTGDLIQGGIVWEKCAKCDLTLPRLLTPIARAVKDFTKIKGARVPLLNFQKSIRKVEGVESFQVEITKEKADDPYSRDWVKVFVSALPDADPETVKSGITKQVKLNTEISPDEIVVESPAAVEKRLFERTGIKADWVVDNRELHI